jgi:superfamily II DNA or RNA helicase
MKLRKYQSDAVAKVVDMIDAPANRRGVIRIPVGSGKSLVIAALIEHYYGQNKKILVVTHSQILIKQNISKLPHLSDVICVYSAGLDKKDLKQITFVLSWQYNARFFQEQIAAQFDFLIYNCGV